MQTEIRNGFFIACEEKSFKNDKGDTIEYMHAYILDDDDNYLRCTVAKDVQQELLNLTPRSDFSCVLEISEESRPDGSTYIKRRIVDVS